MKRLRCLLLVCFFASLLSPVLDAQTASPAPPPAGASASSAINQSDAIPQDTILEYSPPPDNYARAKNYSRAHYRHFFLDSLYGFLLLLVLLRWRVAPWFRNLAERISSRRSVQLILYAPLILLTIAILGIPSDIWDQSLQRAYGLSVQKWGPWLGDWITNQIVMLIVGTLLVGVLYAALRRSPRRWWFYFWLGSI